MKYLSHLVKLSRKEDEGFDILCFDINFDRFLCTLCTLPPTPVLNYDDSGYDCQ